MIVQSMVKAIETVYRGIIFRSRLEAHWAAFFDCLGWKWEYEPIDLKWYIPDFILKFRRPLLVEVKPEVEYEKLEQYCNKIEKSGWKQEYLIVGANLFESDYWDSTIGMLSQTIRGIDADGEEQEELRLGRGLLFTCLICRKPSIYHSSGYWYCMVCGRGDGNGHLGNMENEIELWNNAKNMVRWKPSH